MVGEPLSSAFQEESDSTLVAATKNGESQAFEFLVKRHQTKIFTVAFRITRNREDAQDVVQQSFHKAFVHLSTFQGKSSFSTWLTRIVINEALMCLRRNRAMRQISLEDTESEPGTVFSMDVHNRRESPSDMYEQQERERILCQAMDHLSTEFRTALRLKLEDRTVGEAAQILGVGIVALKSRLFRARRKLRVLLTPSRGIRRTPRL